MLFSSWLRKCKGSIERRSALHQIRRRRSPACRTAPRLDIEVLEDRCLLSAGALDPTFGTGGHVTTDLNVRQPSWDYAQQVVVQDGGKIVVAGTSTQSHGDDFAVACYNSDGSLDTSFGNGGHATVDFGSYQDELSAVTVDGAGRIVLVGTSDRTRVTDTAGPSVSGDDFYYDCAVARLNPDGSLDTTFGDGGRSLLDFGSPFSFATGVAVQADGSVVVVGWSVPGWSDQTQSGQGSDVVVARLNPDGTQDTSFHGGQLLYDGLGTDASALAVAVQPAGNIVVAGTSAGSPAGTGYDFLVLRLKGDTGALDTSFGSGGTQFIDDGSGGDDFTMGMGLDGQGNIVVLGQTGAGWGVARLNANGMIQASDSLSTGPNLGFGSMAVQADGSLVAAGTSEVARFTAGDQLDTSFGNGGVAPIDFGATPFYGPAGVAVQPDGKVMAVGTAPSSYPNPLSPRFTRSSPAFAITRLDADGSLDTSFGDHGRVVTNLGRASDDSPGNNAVAVQADGKVVVAGFAFNPGFESSPVSFSRVSVVRYNADGSLDSSFGDGGRTYIDLTHPYSLNPPGQSPVELAMDSRGRILVSFDDVTTSGVQAVVVARLRADNGALDTTFGDGGKTVLSQPTDAVLGGITVDDQNRILVAYSRNAFPYPSKEVARLNEDGSVDCSFGNNGEVTIGSGNYATHTGVSVDAQDRIVLTGSSGSVARLDCQGNVDTSFGQGGTAYVDFGADGYAIAALVSLDAQGHIVVVGNVRQDFPDAPSIIHFAVVRLNADGSLDTGFGNQGRETVDFGGSVEFAEGMAVQPDGKVVVVGYSDQAQAGRGFDFALARLNATDGSLDSTFGNGGEVLTNFGSDAGAYGVAIQPDRKIVVVGSVDSPSTGSDDFLVARYIGNNAPTVSDGSATTTEDAAVSGQVTATDADNDALTYRAVSGPQHGQLTLQPDGSFTYTPADGYVGADSFTYRAYDGFDYSNAATVSLTVFNVPPTAGVSGTGAGVVNEPLTFILGATDRSTADQVAGFTYTIDWGDGTAQAPDVQTIPASSGNGSGLQVSHSYAQTGSFTAQVWATDKDGGQSSQPATVTTSVSNVLQQGSSLSVGGDGSISLTPGSIIVTINGQTIGEYFGVTGAITVYGGPGADTITVDRAITNTTTIYGGGGNDTLEGGGGTNTLVGGNGTTTFVDNGGTNTIVGGTGQNVFIPGGGHNVFQAPPGVTAPIVFADGYGLFMNGTLSVAPARGLLANDLSTNGKSLTAVLGTGPAHGTLTLDADGSFVYTPTTNFVGSDTFSYQAKGSDGSLSALATASIQVSYKFSGFLPPLSQGLTYAINRTIPIQFQLTDASGKVINSLSAVSSLQIQALDVKGNPVGSPFNPTGTGGTSLNYGAGQYQFNWQTKGLAAGSYQIVLKFADGTTHTRSIQLTGSGSSAGLVTGSDGGTATAGALLGGEVDLYVDNQ
jgi:uncharacterized delta-60 repeat protein